MYTYFLGVFIRPKVENHLRWCSNNGIEIKSLYKREEEAAGYRRPRNYFAYTFGRGSALLLPVYVIRFLGTNFQLSDGRENKGEEREREREEKCAQKRER